MTNQQPLLTTVQAALALNLHQDTLRLWRKQGRGPAWIRVGNRYRYSQEALAAFLEKSKEVK